MKARILVVDDSFFTRQRIVQLLVADGFEVVGEAGSGDDAVRMAERLRPDLVTMDLNLPAMNGLEACRAILSYDPTIRIIVVTASADEENVREAIRIGARGYVTKPFEPKRLLDAVSAALRSLRPTSTMDDQGDDVESIFLVEARQQVELLADGIRRLRESPTSEKAMELVHRAAHTLRGAASMTDHAAIASMAESLENLAIRAKALEITVDDPTLGLLGDSLLGLRRLIADLAAHHTDSTLIENLVTRLRQVGQQRPEVSEATADARVELEGPPLIVVIDDDAVTRHILGTSLTRAGYRVATASNGDDGLAFALRNQPAAVIVDMVMPGIHGIKLVDRLRGSAETADVPILMLTVRRELPNKLSAFEAGVDDYVTKPFQSEEVVARVRALLARSGARRT